ncbi:hypothetical protein F5880DRAFT_1007019 [Lentinula raphanica]|nr:hypothetical protein F5880DRAFT_1007019 [Lentinula raphanica]
MEEREFQAFINRVKSSPDNETSASRQSALEQLVEATRSSSISQKISAAKNIPHFFHYFPEAEEDAINAVYDLCEDQISQVRMAGYDALVQMSRLEKKWVKRNADVLVQLLQNDDQNEVNLVRKALFQHLQFDAQVTLGVLCDQIVPSDDLSDPEELVMRDHLRSLVLTFIASEVKGKRLLRLMPAEGEAEVTLLDGLFSAFPKLSDSAVHIILKDILFQLPFLDKPCSRGSTLSQLVLQNAKRALTDDYSNHDSIRPLNKTRLYFDPLSTLFISKKQGKLDDLIQFYTPMLGKQVLSTITAEDQLELLYHFTETLHAHKTNDSAVFRLLNLTPHFFECLSKTVSSEVRSQETCKLLLQRLKLATGNGYTIPHLVLHGAQSISQVVPNVGWGEEIHGLIRSLAAARLDASTKPTPLSKTSSGPPFPSTSSVTTKSTSLSLPTTSMSLAPSIRPNLTQNLQGGKLLSRRLTYDPETVAHPAKKIKKGGGDQESGRPSLLSRIGTNPSPPRDRARSMSDMNQLHQHTRQPLQHTESLPEGQGPLVIKGAAQREKSFLSVGDDFDQHAGLGPNVESSLRDRLTMNSVHARRNKGRGMV